MHHLYYQCVIQANENPCGAFKYIIEVYLIRGGQGDMHAVYVWVSGCLYACIIQVFLQNINKVKDTFFPIHWATL